MKNLAIITTFLFVLSPKVSAQTFSSLISDVDIQKILSCEIHSIKNNGAHKSSPNKIKSDIVNWKSVVPSKETAVELLKSFSASDEQGNLADISDLFTDTDVDYLQIQIENQLAGKWKIKHFEIKFTENPKKAFYKFSIPLFDKKHETAIIYKEEIYNSIAACATIEIYVKKSNEWEIHKSIILWLV